MAHALPSTSVSTTSTSDLPVGFDFDQIIKDNTLHTVVDPHHWIDNLHSQLPQYEQVNTVDSLLQTCVQNMTNAISKTCYLSTQQTIAAITNQERIANNELQERRNALRKVSPALISHFGDDKHALAVFIYTMLTGHQPSSAQDRDTRHDYHGPFTSYGQTT
jgi:hypothetical protein